MEVNLEKFADLFAKSMDIITTQQRTYTILAETFENVDAISSSSSSSSSASSPFRIRLAVDVWNKEVFIDFFFYPFISAPDVYPSSTFEMMITYIMREIDSANLKMGILSKIREETSNFSISFPDADFLFAHDADFLFAHVAPTSSLHWIHAHSTDSGGTSCYITGDVQINFEINFYERSYDDPPVLNKSCVMAINTVEDNVSLGGFIDKVQQHILQREDITANINLSAYLLTYVGKECVLFAGDDVLGESMSKVVKAKYPNSFRMTLDGAVNFVCTDHFDIGVLK